MRVLFIAVAIVGAVGAEQRDAIVWYQTTSPQQYQPPRPQQPTFVPFQAPSQFTPPSFNAGFNAAPFGPPMQNGRFANNLPPELNDLLDQANIDKNQVASLFEGLQRIGQTVRAEINKLVNSVDTNKNVAVFPSSSFNRPQFDVVSSPPVLRLDVGIAFRRAGITPQFVPVPPAELLNVRFADGNRVNLGNDIKPRTTLYPPVDIDWNAEPGALYTLVVEDFGPQLANDDPIVHWLVVNIGSDKQISRGNVLVEYVPSGPAASGPNRRYVYLVYKQRELINDSEQPYINNRMSEVPRLRESYLNGHHMQGRSEFDLGRFVAKHSLGRPVAGNFYLASCDSSVRGTWAQLGILGQFGDPGC